MLDSKKSLQQQIKKKKRPRFSGRFGTQFLTIKTVSRDQCRASSPRDFASAAAEGQCALIPEDLFRVRGKGNT